MKSLLLLLAAVMVMVGAGSAHAAFTVPVGTVLDLAPVEAWLALAVVAYAGMFGYRKFIKSANRS